MAIETTPTRTRRTKAAEGIIPGAGADLPEAIASIPATEEAKPVSESRPGDDPGVAQNAGADKPIGQPSTPATEAAPSSSPSAEDRAPPADTTNPAIAEAGLSFDYGHRRLLILAVEDGRLPDGAVTAILAALDDGSLIATGTDARFVLEPIDDADAALLTPAAHAVIDAIVDGSMPPSVLEAIKATIDDGTMADVGLRTAAAMEARNERLAPAEPQEERRSFPVVSDVLNGGKLVTAGGIVTVTEAEFVQLRAGLSIPAELLWIDGQ